MMLATTSLSPASIGPSEQLPEISDLTKTQPKLVIEEPVTATYRSPEGALLSVPFEDVSPHAKKKGQLVTEKLMTPTNRRTESAAPRVNAAMYGSAEAENPNGTFGIFQM